MALRVVGLFREFEAQLSYPGFTTARERLRAYLSRSVVGGIDIMTTVLDPLTGRQISSGYGIETDGVWVWRIYLRHVVMDHRPLLDPEFVCARRKWRLVACTEADSRERRLKLRTKPSSATTR